jgi:heavy metal sensor kinase
MSYLYPHSFRGRVARWIGLAFFGLMLLVLLVYSVVMATNLSRAERYRMRRITRGMENLLATLPAPQAEAAIMSGLEMLDPKEDLQVSVYRPDGSLLYAFRNPVPLRLPPPAAGEDYRFEWTITGYENWGYLLRSDTARGIIMMEQPYHTEAIERLLVAAGCCAVLSLVLAALVSAWLGRLVVQPIVQISAAVRQMRSGFLGTRIPDPPRRDEIGELVLALNDTFAQLDRSFHQVSQFSANAAHELRTPLTALRGNLEVCLRRERSADEYRQTIAESIREITHLQELVNALLLLATPGGDRWQQEFRPLHLAPLVEEAAQRLRPMAEGRQIALAVELDAAVTVRGGDLFLGQLVHNLLHNAIKFSPAGGAVRVGLARQGETAVLTVRDQGVGIAPEHQGRIFELFYQVETSRHQGVGLGLALVKWIAEVHQGRVEVQSALGRGATFTVILPLAPADGGMPAGVVAQLSKTT